MSKDLSRDNYYIQTNNPTEMALKTYKGAGWLVSCGPTAAINCMAVLGIPVEVRSPTDKWAWQPEELLLDFLIDPRNREKLNSIRWVEDDISKQEVPQYYPYAVSTLYGATAMFKWCGFDEVWRHVNNGGTAMVCLKNPGHYISVVHHEGARLKYNDSWPQRFDDGNGWMRDMDEDEYRENVQPYAILFFANVQTRTYQ